MSQILGGAAEVEMVYMSRNAQCLVHRVKIPKNWMAFLLWELDGTNVSTTYSDGRFTLFPYVAYIASSIPHTRKEYKRSII